MDKRTVRDTLRIHAADTTCKCCGIRKGDFSGDGWWFGSKWYCDDCADEMEAEDE